MEKQILLTGASGNLGKEVVDKLTALGYHLHVNLRSGKLDLFDSNPGVSGYEADLASEKDGEDFVKKSIEAAGKVEAGIILAGGYAPGKLAATTDEDIEKMIRINFLTAFHVIKPLLSHFEASGGGQLILIGARPALVPKDGAGSFAYALSKSMLFQLAEVINAEGKTKNITASVIVPSTIDTPTNREAMPDSDFTKWIPAADIAEAIVFILGKTGQKMRQTVLKLYNNA